MGGIGACGCKDPPRGVDDLDMSETTPRGFNKVFGIGLSRTGTTSLDVAMWHLGLTSLHNPHPERSVAGDFAFMDEHDAASDISIAHAFVALDEA